MRLAALFILVSCAAAILPACEKIDRNMWYSPAYKPQEEPLRLPPKDSVPTKGRERIPSMAEAAKLKNPVQPTEANARKGKELFGVFCVPCHGESGRGDGPVGGKYVPTPADLTPSGHGSHHSDGQLFAIISSGYGGMPAFRADLPPQERWLIVTYLRALK